MREVAQVEKEARVRGGGLTDVGESWGSERLGRGSGKLEP